VYVAWPSRLFRNGGLCILRGDVQHPPWVVQPAVVESLDAQSLFEAAGFTGAGVAHLGSVTGGEKPHVCFSRGVGPIDFWMLEPV